MAINVDELDSEVLTDIMANMGYEPDSDEGYEAVAKLSIDEAFERWCNWNGLINYGYTIQNALHSIEKAGGKQSC